MLPQVESTKVLFPFSISVHLGWRQLHDCLKRACHQPHRQASVKLNFRNSKQRRPPALFWTIPCYIRHFSVSVLLYVCGKFLSGTLYNKILTRDVSVT